MSMRYRICALVVTSLFFGNTSVRGADASDPLESTFTLSLGTYLIDADTDVTLDGKAGMDGTPIDWEKTFGDGSLSRFRVDAQWRFAERHKLRALWFNSTRSESRTSDREIDWGDETFPVNTRVKGEIEYDIYQLAYEYAFWRRDTYEVSASIGAYYAQFDSSLSATISDAGGTTQRKIAGDASLDAPLPVLGLRGQWVLPYDLNLDVSGQWFALSLDDYSGDLQDYRATLTWQPKTWLGIGIGYDWFSANVDADKTNFRGSLDWTFRGPMIYYSAAF
jgi:hypothetical protein